MLILGMFPISPLRLAIANGDTAMARLLVKHGEPINRLDEDGISALTGAILPNNLQMVRMLISLGADVNQVDSLGMTPLMHASSIDFGDGEVAQALIQAGPDPAS
jgi:ankyrin repeat protein